MARRRKADIELDLRLAEYDADFLQCRDLRHLWTADGAFYEAKDGVRRRLYCGRCETQRIDVWTKQGRRVKNIYTYPEGYCIPGGVENTAVRQEEMRRVEIFASEEDMIASLVSGGKR